MSQWPSGWRETTLRVSGIPVSQYALDVLSAWRSSTPVIPQTYNPLGVPWRGSIYPGYMTTPYALFPGITAFSGEFKRLLRTPRGQDVLAVLIAAESLSDAWRAIHGLGWPGNVTETDYPSALLDMVEEQYRSKMASRTVAKRRTTGIVQAPPEVHAIVRQQSWILHNAATTFNNTSDAIRHIVKGLG